MTWAEIQTRFYELTKTSSADMTAALLNSYITPSVSRLFAKIIIAGGKWQLDDTNYTDLPSATTALVANQQDYSLAVSHLTIDRVEVKDPSGNWRLLKQIDQQDKKGPDAVALRTYKSTPGTPEEYDASGSSVFLYPPSSYSQSASIRFYFARGPLTFDYTTSQFSDGSGSTSSSPGFNSLFHDFIPLYAAYLYCITNLPELASGYLTAAQLLERQVDDFYSLRNRDYPAVIRVQRSGSNSNK